MQLSLTLSQMSALKVKLLDSFQVVFEMLWFTGGNSKTSMAT